MNLLVVIASIVRANHARIALIMGLSESNCQRPFVQWPLVFATGLLILQVAYLAYIMTGFGTAGLEWPWIWFSLLSCSLFLHVFYLQPDSANAHLAVSSIILGILGASGITFEMLVTWFVTYRDLLIQYGSLIGAGLALISYGVGRVLWKRGTGDSHPRIHGIGKSLMEGSYVVSCAVAMAVIVSIFLLNASTPIALSIAIVSVCWLWMACATDQETLAYVAVVGLFATLVYSAHGLLGIPVANNPLAAFFDLARLRCPA